MSDSGDKWMGPKEAAEYTGFALQTIYNKVSQGEIPHHKGSGSTRFKRSELDAWLRGENVEEVA